ncbi:hypothetical protein ACFL4T_09040 [candidate division KSB1 bacterium]
MRRIAFILSVLLIFSYCSIPEFPDDPKAPKWDVEIERIPILSADTLRIGDELSDEDFERVGPDSVLAVNVSSSTAFDISQQLKLKSQTETYSEAIGDFEITADESVDQDVLFSELYPVLAGAEGSSIPVPPTTLTPIENELVFDDFSSVTIVSGRLELQITNNTGFPLGDNVSLDLVDVGNADAIVESLALTRINHGSTGTFYFDLAGKTISGNLKTKLYGDMVGSEGSTVLIPSGANVAIHVTPETIVASSATAKIPSQSFDVSGTVDISQDSLTVIQAEIETGSMTVSVDNPFEYPIVVTMTIPNLTNQFGNQTIAMLNIAPNSNSQTMISLDNSTMDLSVQDLSFQTTLDVSPDPNTFYTLNSADELTVTAQFSKITLSSVTGNFNLKTEFPEIAEEIFADPPEELQNLQFADASLTLTFPGSPFDLDLDIYIRATKGGEVNEIIIDEYIPQGGSLVLSNEIVELLNMIPENLEITGTIIVIGNNVTFTKDDEVSVNYDIELPLEFSLTDASFADSDSLGMDNDVRDQIRDNMVSAGLEITIESTVPLSGTLTMFVGPDSTSITTEILTIGLPAPVIDSNGLVTQAGIQTYNVALTKDEFTAIADAYYFKFEIDLDDLENPAKLTANAYVIVKNVFISGGMTIDPEGF